MSGMRRYRLQGKMQELADAYAASVVREIRSRYGLTPEDFRKSKQVLHVRARRDTIRRLHADGFSQFDICRILRIERSTVAYSISNETKERRKAKALARKMAA